MALGRGVVMLRAMDETIEGKVLITGASGFIGSRLRDSLSASGADVVAIRRPGSPPPKTGRAVEASYDNEARLRSIIGEEKPDYVLHVAGVTKGVSYDDFRRGNVTPTKNLLEALRCEHPGVRRFVHISSLAAFGPSKPHLPLSEDSPRRPIEHYGSSKLEAEEVVESYEDIPWTVLRPSGVYGPGDGDYFELFKSAQRGVNAFFGNAERWFSAVYVDDVVCAILAAPASDATVGKGYFLCDGKPTTWARFQDLVVENTPRKVMTLKLPEAIVSLAAIGGELASKFDGKARLLNKQKAKMGAQEAWTCTHDAARRDFGYAPTVDQAEGVRRAAEWYRANGWL